MIFNLLYTFEKDNRIFQREKFEEHYIPISKTLLLDKLRQMGYEDIKIMNFPAFIPGDNIEETDWYCIIAKRAALSSGLKLQKCV